MTVYDACRHIREKVPEAVASTKGVKGGHTNIHVHTHTHTHTHTHKYLTELINRSMHIFLVCQGRNIFCNIVVEEWLSWQYIAQGKN